METFRGCQKKWQRGITAKSKGSDVRAGAEGFCSLQLRWNSQPCWKLPFQSTTPWKKGCVCGGGWYFYLLGFCFFLSCRVKTFKPVFIPSCFWHASFAIILDPITPTSSSSSSSSSIPDWIPLESTPLGSSYETHLCSLWPHMTRFSWPPRRADADGTSTL